MGLRFRKTISLGKGIRLNIGKTGVSISAGIPGFRKTIHSSGRVTTTVGIPGSGLYYVDTDHIGKNKKQQPRNRGNSAPISKPTQSTISTGSAVTYPNYETPNSKPSSNNQTINRSPTHGYYPANTTEIESPVASVEQDIASELLPSKQLSCGKLFENCDLPVNWMEVLSNREPIDERYDPNTWNYLHTKAIDVFNGNVETMLKIIDEVSPFDDLSSYTSDFSVEMEEPAELGIEFTVAKDIAPREEIQDAVCSVLIRAARDAFALLPIERVTVNVIMDGETIIAAKLNREDFASLEFESKDPSALLEQFDVNMKFSSLLGFRKVDRFD